MNSLKTNPYNIKTIKAELANRLTELFEDNLGYNFELEKTPLLFEEINRVLSNARDWPESDFRAAVNSLSDHINNGIATIEALIMADAFQD